MVILETDRLILRQFTTDDAEFILELVNEPSFIQNIGDRGVRTLEDARAYILRVAISSYEKNDVLRSLNQLLHSCRFAVGPDVNGRNTLDD